MSRWGVYLKSLFGGRLKRALAAYQVRVVAIGDLEPKMQALTDDEIKQAFMDLRVRKNNGETENALLHESFAIVREASKRILGTRHFDEQIIGGMVLFEGKITEMKTGEGKTLTATLPVCLEALSSQGVHVVTVNDYLAKRDSEWMGKIYQALGLTVGVNVGGLSTAEKSSAYQSDITYGTNNEFGFDYLRHNMRYSEDVSIQRPLNYAIVDEVDSILIDEARTPLIISGESNENIAWYSLCSQLAKRFQKGKSEQDTEGDFTVDEKSRVIQLTEKGFELAEKCFVEAGVLSPGESLYASESLPLLHHLDVALRARHLFLRDRDYVVQQGKVVIVDEFTGRLMPGRRWGNNQHQGVEAKEGLEVQKESQTLASTSFQNYFRLYRKLAGMTGTALTEAEEFDFIYGLPTAEIPTHRNMVRVDELDKVYRTKEGKIKAILADIKQAHQKGQPVLVGTVSIEDSELLSGRLAEVGLMHNVLNAKQHDREASIIAQAGAAGAITISTNMAGRGTDIVLGGNKEKRLLEVLQDEEFSPAEKQKRKEEIESEWNLNHDLVVAAGGLRVVGTERHESRRIDNQLRGRSGRQGDPGSSIFYLSFEDTLLSIFATRHVSSLMEKLNIDEDEAIEAKMVSRTIQGAQGKVEAHNFDIRRQLLEYDDIANEQRQLIYEQREEVLITEDIAATAKQIRLTHLESLLDEHLPAEVPEEEWTSEALEKLFTTQYRLDIPISRWLVEEETQSRDYFVEKTQILAESLLEQKIEKIDNPNWDNFSRTLILNIIDDHWRGHLLALDNLRLSIGFRGMAQKNPKQEYKREAFEMFNNLLAVIRMSIARVFYSLAIKTTPPEKSSESLLSSSTPTPNTDSKNTPLVTRGEKGEEGSKGSKEGSIVRQQAKIRRNDPCPCGSGKKYKQCCGKL